MTNPALLETPSPQTLTLPPPQPQGPVGRTSAFVWGRSLLVGSLLAMSYLGAVVVFGCLCRWVQGRVLYAWWRRSPVKERLSFESFCAEMGPHGPCLHPNWLIGQRLDPEGNQLLGWGRSLWLNGRIGFLGLLATCLLVGWGCLLMAFSWEYGWNASFHKDYEVRLVGRSMAAIGVVLFMAAMVYVPMAQIHQAVTGDFRSFFEFRFVGKLIRARLGGYVLYSLLFLELAIVLENLKTIPTGLDDHVAFFSNAGDRELLRMMQLYYFGCSVILLGTLLVTRLILLRIYRGAVLDLVRRGAVSGEELHPTLAKWFARLELYPFPQGPARSSVEQAASLFNEPPATGRLPVATMTPPSGGRLRGDGLRRAAALLLLLAIWFGFVCKVYVGEFFNYHPVIGFLNHPLIQVPCCNYLPDHLGRSADEADLTPP